tara:strand:+ start:358 stop:588 length:231 start_codon:yes stop_codon:yes gene_type:complete
MVELIAATGGAVLTAIFVSAGSLSYRGKRNREDVVSLLTKVELISDKMDDMHSDMRDIYGRLNLLDIAVAELKPKR